MAISGKGFFIWTIRNCEGGDPAAIASVAAQAGLTHVLIKIADGDSSYNIDQATGRDLVPPLIQALRGRGIQPWGWHYIYGVDPLNEADKAIERVQQLGVDVYVIDAEAEFKQPGKDQAARQFMSRLRSALPSFPVVLSSYRYPTYHPQFPWKDFLEKCDYNMPQVYWIQSHNPGEQLIRSAREFQALTPYRPLLATGAAFREGDWQPTPQEMSEFLQTTKDLRLGAANFWSWSHCRKDLPECWEAIKNFAWDGSLPAGDIAEQFIQALNSHDINRVMALYDPAAVHVTARRTLQGASSIRAWYSSLFSQVLPNAAFKLAGFSGSGNFRSFQWTAYSGQGRVNNGNDTLGLMNGKIVYHYSYFDVTL